MMMKDKWKMKRKIKIVKRRSNQRTRVKSFISVSDAQYDLMMLFRFIFNWSRGENFFYLKIISKIQTLFSSSFVFIRFCSQSFLKFDWHECDINCAMRVLSFKVHVISCGIDKHGSFFLFRNDVARFRVYHWEKKKNNAWLKLVNIGQVAIVFHWFRDKKLCYSVINFQHQLATKGDIYMRMQHWNYEMCSCCNHKLKDDTEHWTFL